MTKYAKEKNMQKTCRAPLDNAVWLAYHTRNQTVEGEEYPPQGAAKGAVKSETTARGRAANGLPRAAAKARLGRSR